MQHPTGIGCPAPARYGLCFHWTTWTMPRRGEPLPFEQAVNAFQVERFADMVQQSGASYCFLTATHALQWIPAPIKTLEAALPGRSCGRDLLGEIADALLERGVRFALYYNHSCNNQDDMEWQRASGWLDADKSRFYDLIFGIVREISERYGPRLTAYWFDSAFTLAPLQPDWSRWAQAAKAGNAERLICFNAGVNDFTSYTPLQDYWAGEFDDIHHPHAAPQANADAEGRTKANGLPFHALFWLDDFWGHMEKETPIKAPKYSDVELCDYVAAVLKQHGAVTLNPSIYQDGTVSPATFAQLLKVKAAAHEARQP